jgi:flagellar motor switch protein FliG
MDYNNLKGLDKAAVLLNVFGEPLFLSFFSGIPKEDLMQIRVRSNELSGKIPTVVRKQIIDEFSFLLLQDRYRKSKPDSDRLFQFLEDLSSEEIFYLLSNEPAPKAALAIDQVDDDKRSDFIDRLAPAQKNDVILELGNLADVPLEMVVNVAKELEKKAAHIPQSKEFSRGGGKRMADILNKMNEEEAAEYLSQVQNSDPDLYSDIKKHYLTFSDLLDMNEDTASDFWTNPDIDIDVFSVSVKGIDEEKVKSIVDIMPKKKQAMYQPIEKPMPKKEVMDSRRKLVELAQTIINSGDMKIEDIIGGENQEMIE